MSFFTSLVSRFKAKQNQTKDVQKVTSNVVNDEPIVVENNDAVEGVVELENQTKSTNSQENGVANYADFSKLAKDKYNDKLKRLQAKSDDLTKKIAIGDEAKLTTDNKFLLDSANEKIMSMNKEKSKIENLCNVSQQEFSEVMLHKSNIAYLNMLQRKIAELKKAEKELMSKCSSQAREFAKGCHPILPFDTENTVKSLEDNVTNNNSNI